MDVSIIISTYNSPIWLRKVLWGYEIQDDQDFEIVIADDGSDESSCREIQMIIDQSPLAIRHVWQPDRGFRKTLALNRAVGHCSHDYILFSDGDCIPRRDFVSTHKQYAEKGRFLSGGYVKLPMDLSECIGKLDILRGNVFRLAWLSSRGLPMSCKNTKLVRGDKIARFFDRMTTTRPTFNGQNSSVWKEDLVKVNGFDNRMAYGAEDSELGQRLTNLGVKGKQVRHSAVCIHLDHERNYVSEEGWKLNREILRETKIEQAKLTACGLDSCLKKG